MKLHPRLRIQTRPVVLMLAVSLCSFLSDLTHWQFVFDHRTASVGCQFQTPQRMEFPQGQLFLRWSWYRIWHKQSYHIHRHLGHAACSLFGQTTGAFVPPACLLSCIPTEKPEGAGNRPLFRNKVADQWRRYVTGHEVWRIIWRKDVPFYWLCCN